METIHPNGSPLAAYLEGEGIYDPDYDIPVDSNTSDPASDEREIDEVLSFAPPANLPPYPRLKPINLPSISTEPPPKSAISRLHHAWSSAVNSRLGRAENAKFLEHFRYILVASQLLNEYLDQSALQPGTVPCNGQNKTGEPSHVQTVSMSIYGAALTAAAAFALVFFIHRSRSTRAGSVSKSRAVLVLIGFLLVALVGYACIRQQFLRVLRRQAVATASGLTTNWQALELSFGSSLSFIQEVELVSKGYKISTPMPPISRIEEQPGARRCARLRRSLHKAYAATIPACINACAALAPLIDDDDLERYYEIYDISSQDAREATGSGALDVLEDDPESLKSLRVLSYRSGVLRRITLCSLMALEADGGHPDFHRWRVATATMTALSQTLASSAERVRQTLTETESLDIPSTPSTNSAASNTPARERFRTQVRKISMLSSGIRGLQAKMQILREETHHSIASATDDLVDLGPNLLAQYDAIGQDLRELMHAWEAGRASLQRRLSSRRESRLSIASSLGGGINGGPRSPVSSLGGLTAVEESEAGSPAEALQMLDGRGPGTRLPTSASASSHRASFPVSSSSETDDGSPTTYEAIALPRQRARSNAAALPRDERLARMHEERERQALLRARREANTSMLRELESVISLRPKKGLDGAAARVTSV